MPPIAFRLASVCPLVSSAENEKAVETFFSLSRLLCAAYWRCLSPPNKAVKSGYGADANRIRFFRRIRGLTK